jgi:hypothetical protein
MTCHPDSSETQVLNWGAVSLARRQPQQIELRTFLIHALVLWPIRAFRLQHAAGNARVSHRARWVIHAFQPEA